MTVQLQMQSTEEAYVYGIRVIHYHGIQSSHCQQVKASTAIMGRLNCAQHNLESREGWHMRI
jgi:hypothetical protein